MSGGDDSISALQERISAHTKKASELKTLYNSHASIAKLPPEILSEVFLIQAALIRRDVLDLFSQEADVRHHSFYQWIWVSHVCRHWRETAHNCANLWTWVAFDQRVPTGYPYLFLKHARQLPLTVIFSITDPIGHCEGCLSMDWFFDNFHEQTSEVCALVPRAREILILINRDDFEDRWEDILSASSDVLEVFRIEAYGITRYRQLSLPPRGASVKVVEPLFDSPPPNLRSLSFVGIEYGWSNTLLRPSLRHLELTSCSITESQDNTDLRACLTAMQQLPNLETLKLDWPLLTEIDEAGCTPAALPNLRLLHLRADNQRIVALLSFLQMPPTTSVRLTVLDSFFNDSDRDPFQKKLASLFDNTTIHAVGWGSVPEHPIPRDDRTSCQIWAEQGRRTDSPENEMPWEAVEAAPPRLALEIGFRPSVDVVAPALLQALDLSHVETIHVAGCVPSRAWARALKKAENVKRLIISGAVAFALPAVLAGGVPEDPEEDWQICLSNEATDVDEWHWTAFEGGASASGVADIRNIWDDVPSLPAGIPMDATPDGDAQVPPTIHTAVPPVFPRLRCLQIRDVDFHCPQPSPDVPLRGPDGYYPRCSDAVFTRFSVARAKYGLSTAGLLKCLRIRREQDAAPIERLEFEKCACGDPVLLTGLAGAKLCDVLWDGLPIPQP